MVVVTDTRGSTTFPKSPVTTSDTPLASLRSESPPTVTNEKRNVREPSACSVTVISLSRVSDCPGGVATLAENCCPCAPTVRSSCAASAVSRTRV